MPRLITSTPAARLAWILRSSSANRYGGMRSSRLEGRIRWARSISGEPTQLLHELLSELSAEDGHSPPRQRNAEAIAYHDLELAAVECNGHLRTSAAQHEGHRGAGRTGPARRSLPHSPLEDPRPDPVGAERHEPGHVGAVGKELVSLDLGPDPGQVEQLQRPLVIDADHALRVADVD